MRQLILLSFSAFLLTLILQAPPPIAQKSLGNSITIAQTVSTDEAEIRRIVTLKEKRPITYLKVVDRYAYVVVSDRYTGGAGVYKKEAGRWKVVVETGGTFTVNDLKLFGVPTNVAERLLSSN